VQEGEPGRAWLLVAVSQNDPSGLRKKWKQKSGTRRHRQLLRARSRAGVSWRNFIVFTEVTQQAQLSTAQQSSADSCGTMLDLCQLRIEPEIPFVK